MAISLYMWLSVASEVVALISCGAITKGLPQLGIGPNPDLWYLPVTCFGLAGLFFLLNLTSTGFTVSVFIWIGLVTISSVIYGVILLKEPINMPVWVGFGLIVTGVLLVQLNSSEA